MADRSNNMIFSYLRINFMQKRTYKKTVNHKSIEIDSLLLMSSTGIRLVKVKMRTTYKKVQKYLTVLSQLLVTIPSIFNIDRHVPKYFCLKYYEAISEDMMTGKTWPISYRQKSGYYSNKDVDNHVNVYP